MIQRRINVHVRERSHTLMRAGDLMVEPALRDGLPVRGALAGSGYTTLISIPFTLNNRLGLKPDVATWIERGAVVIWLGAIALAFAAGWQRFRERPPSPQSSPEQGRGGTLPQMRAVEASD